MCIRGLAVAQIVPEPHQHRCRAAIDTQPGVRYTAMVAAVPADDKPNQNSNELSITLPLDYSEIVLPPPDLRLANVNIYREYLEVRDGNTDPSSAGKFSNTP